MVKKIILLSTLIAGSSLFSANAAVLSLSPSTLSTDIGAGPVLIDVVVNGLEAGGANDIVSAYDLTLGFDSSILSFSSISVDGSQFEAFPFGFFAGSDSSTSGEISFSLTSIESDAILQVLQGDSVTLASIAFDTVGTGTSLLDFSHVDITGLGFLGLPLNAATGSQVTVTSNATSVPEPSILALMSLGLLGFGVVRRKARL